MDWLIWSIEHEAWWAPNRHGYTRNVGLAGRYSEVEALEILQDANLVHFHECMIPVECIDDGER
jgi:hypothetical protein